MKRSEPPPPPEEPQVIEILRALGCAHELLTQVQDKLAAVLRALRPFPPEAKPSVMESCKQLLETLRPFPPEAKLSVMESCKQLLERQKRIKWC